MADNKGTIYQNLNRFFNLNTSGFDEPLQTPVNDTNGFKNNKIIIKGDSPEDIQRKGEELQQKRVISANFNKTIEKGYQKAMLFESSRLGAYTDYEGMEYYPIIAAALNLFMEEATTIGFNGKMLNIYSNKDRIKSHLEDLFYNVLNINVVLPLWTRNMVKLGDNFVYLYGEKSKGIIHAKQLVNYDIERIEKFENGRPIIRFKHKQATDANFNSFEIAHFRLLSDDKSLPYGFSILNKIRRVFRALIMAEDAMVTYRLLRAGEKRVFNIDVGNIDEDDVEAYIHKISTLFKKSSQVNSNNGQIDYRFNVMTNDEDYFIPRRNATNGTTIETIAGACLALNTKIELLDGRSLELNEIIDEYSKCNELWSYSINPNSGEIVPGKITWAGVTRKNTEVIKITIDNGESITCTPDHKFPTILGVIKEAKDLNINESLWAFNKEFIELNKNNKQLEGKFNEFTFDHKIVSIEYLVEKQDTGTITIDGGEELHNYHNFALTCGVFTNNSNLSDIADIQYLRDLLFTGLEVPKPFLSFQDAAGAGKNMAQYDIRFAKKIMRIQQALILELNKMAMIHLVYLGFSGDDLKDFELTLSSPSTQHEILKTELYEARARVFGELTKSDVGLAPMSYTLAKKLIFNMSDTEIVRDLKVMRMERAIMQELVDTPLLIKKTGLFNDIDNKYGDKDILLNPKAASGSTESNSSETTDMGASNEVPQIPGAEFQSPNDLPPISGESYQSKKDRIDEMRFDHKLTQLMKEVNSEKLNINTENKQIIKENKMINDDINEKALTMIDEIDNLLQEANDNKSGIEIYFNQDHYNE